MKKFFKISIIYSILILLYLFVGEYLLYRIKENIPIHKVVELQMQSKEESYYGRIIFSDVVSRYKYEALQFTKPSIITLGQSIVMNYRDFFFHPYEKDFYNTGLMAKTLEDFIHFGNLLENGTVKKPEFMVVGLDYGFVTGNNDLDRKQWLNDSETDDVYDFKTHLRAIQTVIINKDYHKIPTECYGFGRKGLVGNGYRKDGSYAYQWETQNLVRDSVHNEGPNIELFKNKQNRYRNDAFLDSAKVEKLFSVLNKYRNMGIEILIYVPPVSDAFYSVLMADVSFKHFWSQYLMVINQFEEKGFDVIKFTTPSGMGLTDYSMNNSDHPGDVMVAKQFYAYCVSPTRKNKFIDKIDTAYLKRMIDAPETNSLSFMKDRWN